MKAMLSVCVLYILVVGGTRATDRPIIGVLTQEVNPSTYPDHSSFIPASYVKAVEQAGARVVPIFINQTKGYYKKTLDSVNGVLFPGGSVLFTNKGGFADAGRVIVEYVKQRNVAGDHFPIFGVCLGFELFFYLDLESYDVLGNCSAVDISLPLEFSSHFRNSSLYHNINRDVVHILHNQPVTFNYHERCITNNLLKQHNLREKWHTLSTSTDVNSLVFISSAEYHQYPIAGVQFHPEKNAFEWNPKYKFPHSKDALTVTRYFYDWLVREARKNNHSFSSSEVEDATLIYNYNATYVNKYYEQVYLFD